MITDHQVLLGMIDCTQEEVDQILYDLSEEFEDKHCISGIWTSGIFRNFWTNIVQRASQEFLECIQLRADGSYCLQSFSRGEHEFIYGNKEIRKRYFRFIRNRIMKEPINASIMEIINFK